MAGALFVVAAMTASCTPSSTVDPRPAPSGSPEVEAERPNILFVITDDMRPDGLDAMPFTANWLIKGGRTYTNAYATTPLCCPSRASFFTGRYAHNHKVLKNHDSHDLDTGTTIQAYLQDQTDYRTAIVGKYLNSWRVDENPPHFDRWASYSGRYYGKPFNINGEPVPTTDYSTYHMAERSKQFLRAFEQEDDKPWYLYVATVAPHAPFTIAPQHRAADVPIIGRRPAGLPPGFGERDLSDKPDLPVRPFEYDRTRQLRKKQWRTLLAVDDMMRQLRAILRRLGEERDTLVVFTSDQGLLQGEHGLFAKRLPYTEAIQIPLLVRWPGHVGQDSEERLVANVDVAPTIFEVAGIDAPVAPDGVSLLSDVERSALFIEQLENWRVGLADWYSIRTHDLQYVEYYGRDGALIEREYYDLHSDPWQLRNLLGDEDPGNDPEFDELSQRIAEMRACSGEDCVITE